jgi:hypothetical protein
MMREGTWSFVREIRRVGRCDREVVEGGGGGGVLNLEVHVEVIVVYGGIEVPARDVTKTNRANSAIASQVVQVLRGLLLQRDEGVVPTGEWRVTGDELGATERAGRVIAMAGLTRLRART